MRIPAPLGGVAVVCCLALLGSVAGPVSAKAAPPPGFFGVVPQAAPTAGDFARMQGVVGTVRIRVDWAQVEPQPGEYDFGELDAEIAMAARRGIDVLPFVVATPAWISPDPSRSPMKSARGRRAWPGFLRLLVRRYGPGGSLWKGRSGRSPIRRWQIWNEPNFRLSWHPHPSPVEYARLLASAARVIRRADPTAQIVLAGVAPVGAGLWPWVFLRRLYRVPGVKKNFDIAAVHPYAADVREMSGQVRSARIVMAEAGDDRTPLLVSEVGVASWGTFPSAFVKGLDGQARFLQRAFAHLLDMRRRWRLAGIDWFSWQDQEQPDRRCSFCQGAGLLDLQGRPKPAWGAFRRAVEEARAR
jgi:hypothetical protein